MTQTSSTPVRASYPKRPGRWARGATVLLLVITLAFAITGCGSSGSSSSGASPHVHFAKTKFVLHAGLAFGAFHRYIYKPFRSGGFSPVSQRKLAIVKAGAAGLFAYHEIKEALVDARSSSTLSHLVSPLLVLQTRLHGLGTGLHSGHLNGGNISQTNSAVSRLASRSASRGVSIHDLATPSLG